MRTDLLTSRPATAAPRSTPILSGHWYVVAGCDLRWMAAIAVLCGLLLRFVALH